MVSCSVHLDNVTRWPFRYCNCPLVQVNTGIAGGASAAPFSPVHLVASLASNYVQPGPCMSRLQQPGLPAVSSVPLPAALGVFCSCLRLVPNEEKEGKGEKQGSGLLHCSSPKEGGKLLLQPAGAPSAVSQQPARFTAD